MLKQKLDLFRKDVQRAQVRKHRQSVSAPEHHVSDSSLSQFHQTQHTLVRRDTCGECSWLCR